MEGHSSGISQHFLECCFEILTRSFANNCVTVGSATVTPALICTVPLQCLPLLLCICEECSHAWGVSQLPGNFASLISLARPFAVQDSSPLPLQRLRVHYTYQRKSAPFITHERFRRVLDGLHSVRCKSCNQDIQKAWLYGVTMLTVMLQREV